MTEGLKSKIVWQKDKNFGNTCTLLQNEATKELQALHKEIVDTQNECVSKLQIEIKQLQEENERLKKEAKTIIQDLLSNSDEYARQRAMDWLKEE